MPRPSSIACCLLLATLAGCASAPKPESADQIPGAGTLRPAPDLITAAEISRSGAANALEAITRLRPNWMRNRGTNSISGGAIRSGEIVVYLDGTRLGDVVALRTLSVAGLKSIQWLDAARASAVLSNLGSSPIAGAIVIKSL